MNRRWFSLVVGVVFAASLFVPSVVTAKERSAGSVVVPYPKLATDVDDPNSVKVNGVQVYVHGLHWHVTSGDTNDIPMNDNGWAYAHFAFAGTAHYYAADPATGPRRRYSPPLTT